MSNSSLDTYTRNKGRQIQARLRQKSGNKTFRTMDLAKEVVRLSGDPYNWPRTRIAAALEVTERRIRQALQEHERVNTTKPIAQDIDERFLGMLEWTVEAFEAFFLEFSGYSYMPKHVKPWVEAFLRERRLLLNVPPRHAKSEFFMIWIPVWLICRDRNVQVLLVSNASEDAATWAMEIAGQLEHNEDLIRAYRRFKPEKEGEQKWTPSSGTFSVVGRTKRAKGAQFTVESRGMEGRVLGREADFVIVDDPTKSEDADSETTRRKQLKHLREQVFTRAEPQGDKPGGRICVIGQRVHIMDLYGELEKQEWEIGPLKGEKLWHTEKYPAVLDWDTKKVLWPERFPWEEIMLAYASVGGLGPFSCLYQQEPMPEGTLTFRREWLEACKDYDRPARKGVRAELDENAFLPIVRVVSVDPSPSKFEGIIVGDLLCHKENFHFVITDIIRKPAGVRELKALVDQIIDSQHPDYFVFEESGFLKWFREDPWFENLKDRIRVKLHHTGVNKNSAEYGVQSLAGDFEFGRIRFPYGDETGKRGTDLLIGEALLFPDGELYDLLMALWFVKFNYKKLSPVRFLPTRIKGSTQGGWSWMKKVKERKQTEDQIYRRWQKQKAQQRDEMRKVSVG